MYQYNFNKSSTGAPFITLDQIESLTEQILNKYCPSAIENFEAVDIAMNGGYDFTDSYGNKMKSLEGMARWVPRNGFQKAGVGAYRMEAEFGTNPEYKNMRNAIQIMNPSSHTLLKK